MKPGTKRVIIGVLTLVAILALAWPKLNLSGSSANTDLPAQPTGSNALRVQAQVVMPQVLRDRIFTTGSIRANEEVEVRSETSGIITGIYFQEGRRVGKGALLLKINDSELQAQLRKAEYRATLAIDRERRQKQLFDKGGISQEEYEATLNEVNVLKSDIELIKAQVDRTEIRAPFNGTIGLRQVSKGSYITPATPITTLQDINPVKIDFSIPERYAQRVQPGDDVFFEVEGQDGTFKGTIYASEPKIEANTRTLQLRARSDNADGRLLPGAFADIELVFEEIPGALTVPALAIIPELGGKKVYVVQDGKAMPRPVETGIRTDENVQVIDGLQPQDTVIVSGIQQLRPGLSVLPTVPDAAAVSASAPTPQ